MGVEIERKFLVAGDGWQKHVVQSGAIVQGYLTDGGAVTLRIRIIEQSTALLTIKGARQGLSRPEFEYDIPLTDARDMLALAGGAVIRKRRFLLDLSGGEWIVDVFEGEHHGLVLAEVELPAPDAVVTLPDWLGDEVTDDPRYYNSALAAQARQQNPR
jgi:adenylate cyclase